MPKITMLIVDDHTLLRETWGYILNAHERFQVVADAGNGEDAIKLVALHKPDLVMMDINLPGINGIEATAEILKISPETKVLGVSLHSQPVYARKMMACGAHGYVTKNSAREEMLLALNEVAEGRRYICHEIKNILSEQMINGSGQQELPVLSAREKEIIRLLKTGNSSKEIADNLFISVKTVEVHRYNILRKLNLKNAAALVNYINQNEIWF